MIKRKGGRAWEEEETEQEKEREGGAYGEERRTLLMVKSVSYRSDLGLWRPNNRA